MTIRSVYGGRALSKSGTNTFAAPGAAVRAAIIFSLGISVPVLAPADPSANVRFAKCPDLPLPRQMHGSAVVGSRLLVFGGATQAGWTREVISAQIDPEGRLGVWEPEEPLPQNRVNIGNAVEVVNDRIYVVGGWKADAPNTPEAQLQPQQDTLWTKLLPNGKLAPWQTSYPFPGDGRVGAATCSNHNGLYVVGGRGNTQISDTILVANFAGDGTPENWHFAAKLPTPLWQHGATVFEDRLYVWGGLTGADPNTASSKVYSCPIQPDRTLGKWREEQPLPTGVYAAAYSRTNEFLISLRGYTSGGQPAPAVLYARIQNGRVGPWQTLGANVEAHSSHAAARDETRGSVFVTGGSTSATPSAGAMAQVVDAVQYFRLSGDMADASRQASSGRGKLLYFRADRVPPVERFEQATLNTPEFKQASAPYEFLSIDTNKDAATASKYGVYRVPAMVIVAPDGSVRRSKILRGVGDVTTFLSE